MELVVSCVWLAIVLCLIARAVRQRGLLPALAMAPPPADPPRVAVIVPARDEQANIGRCLGALLAQTYPASRLQMVVVDDHSSDATFALATAMAARDARLCVLRSPPLPLRWTGKSHACWIGAKAASDADWFCFLDADVWAEPALIASALATAKSRHLDLLSLAPRQELESFAERLVMPCGLYVLAFSQDLRRVQESHGADATATGQFMLVRRAAYERVGGHATVHAAICEDLALARLVKRSGARVLLYDGHRLLATRMYAGWGSLWLGLSKNLSEMLKGPARTIGLAIAALVLAWAAVLVPAGAAAACAHGAPSACWALAPALLGSAAAFGLHLAGAVYFRIPLWYGLLFPLGYSVGTLLALDSVRRRLSGRVIWKGRTYP